MDSTPFTPRHKPDRQHELCWHSTCTHITWRPRKTPLPPDLPEDQIPTAPKRLPEGSPCCPTCSNAQDHPDEGTPRLILSLFARRITAIGFPRARKEELKALRFQWGHVSGAWVYLAEDGPSLEACLPRLATALGCRSEVADTQQLPPSPVGEVTSFSRPSPPAQSSVTSSTPRLPGGAPTPEWAVITCLRPGEKPRQDAEKQRRFPIIATLDWPPSLASVKAAAASNSLVNTPRVLVLSSLPELKELGFTQQALWQLISDLVGIGIAISAKGGGFDLAALLPVLCQLTPHPSFDPTLSPQASRGAPANDPSSLLTGTQTEAKVVARAAEPEAQRELRLPPIPELIQRGFTRTDLFRLAEQLSLLGIGLRTEDGQLDLTQCIAFAGHLLRGPHPGVPPSSKSKGGRPATARARNAEVLELHKKGLSAAAIARELGISDRSVRRLLPLEPRSPFPPGSNVP